MSLKSISNTAFALNNEWLKVDLSDLNSFYLIGIKQPKTGSSTIDSSDVASISFDVGVECGIQNEYLNIGSLNLNFNEFTSKKKDVNEITAMSRYLNFPNIFYIKPVEIFTKNGEKIVEGTVDIIVNINSLKLK